MPTLIVRRCSLAAIEYLKKSLALFTQMGAKLQMGKIQSWLDDAQVQQSK